MSVDDSTKRCMKCRIDKPFTSFFKNKTKADGHQDYCKECKKVTDKNYFRGYKRTYNESQRKRRYIRNAVHHRVENGVMPPASDLACTHCGKQAEQYHHHKGYAFENRLDVIPLCIPCHRIADRKQ